MPKASTDIRVRHATKADVPARDSLIRNLAKGLPHFFGVTLGVAPEMQRSGVGQAIVAHCRAEAEHAGVPLFGVCKDGNVAYYEAAGAQRVGRVRIGRSGPEVNVVMYLPKSLRPGSR